MTAFNSVPVIDLTPARLGTAAERLEVAQKIDQAARTIGFLVVSGHGVSKEVIDRASDAARRFFDQSSDEKAKSRPPSPEIYRGYFGLETGNLASTIDDENALATWDCTSRAARANCPADASCGAFGPSSSPSARRFRTA